MNGTRLQRWTPLFRHLFVVILCLASALLALVTLHYGGVPMLMGYLTVWLSVLTLLGLRWLYHSSPTADSARAVRTLMRGFWVASGALAGVAVIAGFGFGAAIFWLLPSPFLFPALLGSVYYEETFRGIENLPFWKRGL